MSVSEKAAVVDAVKEVAGEEIAVATEELEAMKMAERPSTHEGEGEAVAVAEGGEKRIEQLQSMPSLASPTPPPPSHPRTSRSPP